MMISHGLEFMNMIINPWLSDRHISHSLNQLNKIAFLLSLALIIFRLIISFCMKTALFDDDQNILARSPSSSSRPSSSSATSKKFYDRHVTRIDKEKFDLESDTSSDRSKSKEKSYVESLEECLLSKSSIKDFTLQKSTKKKVEEKKHECSKSYRKSKIEASRAFRVKGWQDNYYTNLLDWSSKNFICAAYDHELFFYNMAHQDDLDTALYRRYRMPSSSETLSSVKFAPFETKIALGYSNGLFKIYDFLREKVIFNEKLHTKRIAALEWESANILTGSKDHTIKSIDHRTKQILTFPHNHKQEVCGVKEKDCLVASGGNDNSVYIYDLRKIQHKLASYKHDAAIKAITWIPKIRTLATGGGTTDKKIKFWKDTEGIVKEIDTGSQVCSLLTSKTTDELVSCQGFSLNQIVIWNFLGGRQATIHGHTSRVLYSALSPTGEYLVSGAGDQTMKLWKIFPQEEKRDTLFYRQIR